MCETARVYYELNARLSSRMHISMIRKPNVSHIALPITYLIWQLGHVVINRHTHTYNIYLSTVYDSAKLLFSTSIRLAFHIPRRTSLDILINCNIILLSHNRKAIDIQLCIARERYDANKSEDLIYYPSDRGSILRYRERPRQLSPWATAKANAFRAILSPVLRFSSRPFFSR